MADTFTKFSDYIKAYTGLLAMGLNTALGKLHLKGTSSLASVSATSRLTADGTFDAATGWTVGSGWAISGGKATHTSGIAALSGTTNALLAEVVEIIVTLSGVTTGSVVPFINGEDTGYTLTADGVNILFAYVPLLNSSISFVPTTDFNGSMETVQIFKMTPSVPELILENSDGNSTNVEIRAGSEHGYNIGVGRLASSYVMPGRKGYQTGINVNAFGERCVASNVDACYVNAMGQETLLRLVDGFGVTAVGDAVFRYTPVGTYITGVGYQAGVYLKRTIGSNFYGAYAGMNMIKADYCDISGFESCANVSEGTYINTTGRRSIVSNPTNPLIGSRINAFGSFAAYILEGLASDISAFGHSCLAKLKVSNYMTAFGNYAGYGTGGDTTNAPETDEYGTFIGFGSNRTVASATKLTDYTAVGAYAKVDKSHQMVYGASTIEEHLFRSGKIKALGFSTFADNAAAITGGLTAGDFYKTVTGELRIVV